MRLILVGVLMSLSVSGCAAVFGAAMAAGEIRQGLAGMQELISSARDLPEAGEAPLANMNAPIAGTYRGYQALGRDTVRFHVRTARQPLAPIVDDEGMVMGYALHAIAAVTLDTLEARVETLSTLGSDQTPGRAIFFIEGTQPPNVSGRTLYPAAFVGQVGRGESRIADRHNQRLLEQDVEMLAPDFLELEGQAVPYELFGSVAEGVFTLRADGSALYEQEYELEDDDALVLYFERISRTTLP